MKALKYFCLNPCFNGIQSNVFIPQKGMTVRCLNPCFNGIQSNKAITSGLITKEAVLILVLMEYNQTVKLLDELSRDAGLNPCFNGIQSNNL